MAKSMTGFSRVTRVLPWGNVTVEASSVNSRYVEVQWRGPKEWAGFESRAVSLVRGALGRGKVLLRLDVTPVPGQSVLNLEGLKNLYQTLKPLALELSAPLPQLEALVPLLPTTPLGQEREEGVEGLIQEALLGLDSDRAREGSALTADMLEKLSSYRQLMAKIEDHWLKAKETAFASWRERVESAIQNLGAVPDQNILTTELVTAADKWDVTEELTRTKAHIEHFEGLLKAQGPVGRKLDFMLQEMNREINTLGSKVNDQELRWMVVEGKSLLESLREQAQNVE